jgi:hypothetical protein
VDGKVTRKSLGRSCDNNSKRIGNESILRRVPPPAVVINPIAFLYRWNKSDAAGWRSALRGRASTRGNTGKGDPNVYQDSRLCFGRGACCGAGRGSLGSLADLGRSIVRHGSDSDAWHARDHRDQRQQLQHDEPRQQRQRHDDGDERLEFAFDG